MGNRCIIATQEDYNNNGAGLYLHWNGGRDSVEGFLMYAKLQGCRGGGYGLARLAQYIGNWFGGTLSIGIEPARCGAGDDNGVYIINDNFEIIDRKELFEGFEEQNEYDIWEVVEAVNEAQPAGVAIPEAILHKMVMMERYPISYAEKLELITVGTEVYMRDFAGRFERCTVKGFGKPGQVCNGHDVEGIPYVDRYDGTGDYSTNANNYIFEQTEIYFA